MRFMMIMKANKESEAGVMPSNEIISAMMAYNEELVKAGVLLDGDGLQPSSAGVRLAWSGGKPVLIDGPFAETKELIAGYWIIQVKSKEEAIEWLKRIPHPADTDGPMVELRPYFEMPITTDETLIAREAELRSRVEKQKQSRPVVMSMAVSMRSGGSSQPESSPLSPGSCVTSAWRRSSPRMRSSPHSNSGPSQVSRSTRAPGS
jgi:hypothetical protein